MQPLTDIQNERAKEARPGRSRKEALLRQFALQWRCHFSRQFCGKFQDRWKYFAHWFLEKTATRLEKLFLPDNKNFFPGKFFLAEQSSFASRVFFQHYFSITPYELKAVGKFFARSRKTKDMFHFGNFQQKKVTGMRKNPYHRRFSLSRGPAVEANGFHANGKQAHPQFFPDEKLFLFSRCASVNVHAISTRSLSSSGARAELNENGKKEEEEGKWELRWKGGGGGDWPGGENAYALLETRRTCAVLSKIFWRKKVRAFCQFWFWLKNLFQFGLDLIL